MRIERAQPPVGYRFPLSRLGIAACTAFAGGSARDAFEREFAGWLDVPNVFAVSSGKAALAIALRALAGLSGRRKVIVPAYTCYSLPSAIVKAGLEVVPCDVAADSFDFDFDRLLPLLDSEVLCVISVHLFGIQSDVTRVKAACRSRGIFVVEDAAQAMGTALNGAPAGISSDVAVFSLGRGKNVTCGTGGILVTPSPRLARAIGAALEGVPANGFAEDARTFVSLLLQSLCIDPRLYWLPRALPFLRLGETIFHADFPVRLLSHFQARLLAGWKETLETLTAIRREHAEFYRAHIPNARGCDRGISYLRFPVVLEDADQKRRLLKEWNGEALGLSGMYPGDVASIPELRGRVAAGSFPRAERLARTLITLPTHPLLTAADRRKVCELVNAVLQKPAVAIAS